MDGVSWAIGDQKEDSYGLNRLGFVGTWRIANAPDSKFVRFRLTEPNHESQDPESCHLLEISAFELYATVLVD
jgi:hypothetical protein